MIKNNEPFSQHQQHPAFLSPHQLNTTRAPPSSQHNNTAPLQNTANPNRQSNTLRTNTKNNNNSTSGGMKTEWTVNGMKNNQFPQEQQQQRANNNRSSTTQLSQSRQQRQTSDLRLPAPQAQQRNTQKHEKSCLEKTTTFITGNISFFFKNLWRKFMAVPFFFVIVNYFLPFCLEVAILSIHFDELHRLPSDAPFLGWSWFPRLRNYVVAESIVATLLLAKFVFDLVSLKQVGFSFLRSVLSFHFFVSIVVLPMMMYPGFVNNAAAFTSGSSVVVNPTSENAWKASIGNVTTSTLNMIQTGEVIFSIPSVAVWRIWIIYDIIQTLIFASSTVSKSFRAIVFQLSFIFTLFFNCMGTMQLIFCVEQGRFVDLGTSFYFTTVTLTTVGYGDYAPTSALGRAFIITQIFAALIAVPLLLSETDRLFKFLLSLTGYAGSDRHIIIFGELTEAELDQLLCERTAGDGLNDPLHMVFVAPKFSSEFQDKVAASPRSDMMTLCVANQLSRTELLRFTPSRADAALFYSNTQAAAMRGDYRTIAAAASVRLHHPSLPQYLMMRRTDTAHLVEGAFVVFDRDFLRAALLGTSLQIPGFLPMFLNLIRHVPDKELGIDPIMKEYRKRKLEFEQIQIRKQRIEDELEEQEGFINYQNRKSRKSSSGLDDDEDDNDDYDDEDGSNSDASGSGTSRRTKHQQQQQRSETGKRFASSSSSNNNKNHHQNAHHRNHKHSPSRYQPRTMKERAAEAYQKQQEERAEAQRLNEERKKYGAFAHLMKNNQSQSANAGTGNGIENFNDGNNNNNNNRNKKKKSFWDQYQERRSPHDARPKTEEELDREQAQNINNQSWYNMYLRGAKQNIYTIAVPEVLVGRTFVTASFIVQLRTGALPIGLVRDSKVSLNAGITPIQDMDSLVVIAPSWSQLQSDFSNFPATSEHADITTVTKFALRGKEVQFATEHHATATALWLANCHNYFPFQNHVILVDLASFVSEPELCLEESFQREQFQVRDMIALASRFAKWQSFVLLSLNPVSELLQQEWAASGRQPIFHIQRSPLDPESLKLCKIGRCMSILIFSSLHVSSANDATFRSAMLTVNRQVMTAVQVEMTNRNNNNASSFSSSSSSSKSPNSNNSSWSHPNVITVIGNPNEALLLTPEQVSFERETIEHDAHCCAFATGGALSPTLLDGLMFRTYYNEYLPQIVELMLEPEAIARESAKSLVPALFDDDIDEAAKDAAERYREKKERRRNRRRAAAADAARQHNHQQDGGRAVRFEEPSDDDDRDDRDDFDDDQDSDDSAADKQQRNNSNKLKNYVNASNTSSLYHNFGDRKLPTFGQICRVMTASKVICFGFSRVIQTPERGVDTLGKVFFYTNPELSTLIMPDDYIFFLSPWSNARLARDFFA